MTDVVDSPRSALSALRSRWALLAGAVLILAGIGTVAYQGWPELAYELGLIDSGYPYPCAFAEQSGARPASDHIPRGTRLVIPTIGVDAQVYGGDYDSALERGVYHHSETADPGQGANVAIAGHRVRRAFTLLHRLGPGDEIILYWNGVEHDYRVDSVFEIEPEETSILEPGDREKLTLYTCTPRFEGDRRTALIALPVAR